MTTSRTAECNVVISQVRVSVILTRPFGMLPAQRAISVDKRPTFRAADFNATARLPRTRGAKIFLLT
jgi:hypothetical protein